MLFWYSRKARCKYACNGLERQRAVVKRCLETETTRLVVGLARWVWTVWWSFGHRLIGSIICFN